MTTKSVKGRLPSAEIQDAVRAALTRALGASNMQDRALGLGTPKHGRLVGKQNAVWSQVVVSATTDLNDLEVPHSLGAVPVLCRLEFWDNVDTPDLFLVSRPVAVHKWTKSTCRVAVSKVGGAGSTVGTVLTFFVGGP